MVLTSFFSDFLREIRPTKDQRSHARAGHRTLRDRLLADGKLAPIIVGTFLQGSYRRATAVRPLGDESLDVDVVAVTKLSQVEYPDPNAAMKLFAPFLDEYYKGKYEFQGRSVGIGLSYVHLDLVITSAPSESEWGILKADAVAADDTPEDTNDWRLVSSWLSMERRTAASATALLEKAAAEAEWTLTPLYIPDREAKRWQATHPLVQIQWTWGKNNRCGGHYVNVVKAIKWWRRISHPTPKYPKGYPVEHLIGQCCPDGITSVAEGVTLTLEAIAEQYETYALLKQTPYLRDHGVVQNVLARVSGDDFAVFHSQVCDAAKVARCAFDSQDKVESANEWCKLFGDRFPKAETGSNSSREQPGFTPQAGVALPTRERFA